VTEGMKSASTLAPRAEFRPCHWKPSAIY